jgi:hypothetical protein
MKQIRLRLAVTAEDETAIGDVQSHLTEMLNKLGTQRMALPDGVEGEDLGGVVLGPRVFWETVEILQGAERDNGNPPPRQRSRVTRA